MRKTIVGVAAIAATVCLASCGGGGGGSGGDGTIGVTFTPGTITESFSNTDTPSWTVSVKFTEVPSQAVALRLLDNGQAFGAQTLVASSSDGGYTWAGRLSPRTGLAASATPYTGALTLQLCKDAACASQYALTGNVLAYSLTVAAPTGPCVPNAPIITSGTYAVENDAYGNAHLANPVQNFTQCVYVSAAPSAAVDASWTWSWPSVGTDLRAYPEVEYGQKPWWTAPTPNALLPRQLSKIASVTAHVDFTDKNLSAFKGYLVFDTYFARSMTFSSVTKHVPVVGFLEVFLKSYGGQQWGGPVARTVHIGSCDWNVENVQTADGWPLIAYFPAPTCTLANPIDLELMAFVHDYMQNEGNGVVSDTDYFTSVELGTQIFQGSGELDLNDYSVTVTTK